MNINDVIPSIPRALSLSVADVAALVELSGDQIATIKDRLARCGTTEVRPLIERAGNCRMFVPRTRSGRRVSRT